MHIDRRRDRAGLNRNSDTVVREVKGPRQGDIAERESACSTHRPRHIGNAIVDDFMLDKNWIAVSRRVGRLNTTSLIHRHVNDHAPRLHDLQIFLGD